MIKIKKILLVATTVATLSAENAVYDIQGGYGHVYGDSPTTTIYLPTPNGFSAHTYDN